MIRLPYRHHVLVPGGHQGQPQGQVDRLGSRVDHEHGVQRRGQQAGQPLGELHHRGVVEPGVGVQPAQLPGHRGLHPRVRVAEHGHVVHHVQVDPAAGGGQVVPPAPLDPRRVRVVVLLHRRERSRAPAKQVIPGSRGDGRQSQQRPRIRDQRQPPRRVFRPDQRRHLGRALRGQAHVHPVAVRVHVSRAWQRHRGGRPQVDPGRDGRGGDLGQHPRPGQPRLAEPGRHNVVPLGQQGRSQPVLEPRLQPRPLVHRVGSADRSSTAQRPRSSATRTGPRRLTAQPELGQDQARHHLGRDRHGLLEQAPFVLQRAGHVVVDAVDGGLLLAADH